MNKYIFIALFICAATVANAQNMTKYVSDSLNFSFEYPENWQMVDGYSSDILLKVKAPLESEDDNFRENLNITIHDSMYMTLEDFTSLAVEQYKTYLYNTSIDTIVYGKSDKGQKYSYIRYSCTDKGRSMELLTYIYIRDRTAYVINCTMRLTTYIKYENTFIKMCQSFTFIQNMTKYVSDSLNFSLTYPEDWQLMEDYMPNIPVMALSPPADASDNFTENVNIVYEKVKQKNITLEKYTSLSTLSISLYLEEAAIDSIAADTTAAGLPCKYIIYHHTSQGNKCKVLAYFCLHNNMGYVITCTAKTDTYAGYEKTFREICRSFTILRKE